MNENDYQKINFRIILDSEAILDLDSDGQPAMLASSVMSQIRWACRHLLGSESAEEEAIFGSLGQAAKILALPMTFHGSPDVRLNVALDPFTGSAKDAALFEEFIVPAGATIIGAIIVSRSLALRYRTLIQSAILNIEQSGIGKRARSGFGRCHVEFVDFKDIGRVFISYTWEDEGHNEWVLRLADRLTKDGISVIFDRYDLKIGDNMHVFMEQSVESATKVILILTPVFKERADNRKGGAGYEFSMVASELFETIAENNKFLPVLRRGNFKESTPTVLRPFLACNMTEEKHFESAYSELYTAISGSNASRRPKCRV